MTAPSAPTYGRDGGPSAIPRGLFCGVRMSQESYAERVIRSRERQLGSTGAQPRFPKNERVPKCTVAKTGYAYEVKVIA